MIQALKRSAVFSELNESELALVSGFAAEHPEIEAKLRRALERTAWEEDEPRNTRDLVSLLACARMSALGQLCAAVAHEINNPLTNINLNADLIARVETRGGFGHPENARVVLDSVSKIKATVQRIFKTISGLRGFARADQSETPQAARLSQILRDALDVCQERLQTQPILIEIADFPEALQVTCRGAQISQILSHLLFNAFDAVENQKERRIRIEIRCDADEIEISILDSGPGVPKGMQDRIFDHFVTARKPGAGLGLGLSISRNLAESHGGSLCLDPESKETRFVLRLPSALSA